jgi:site-specific recombinase XerD
MNAKGYAPKSIVNYTREMRYLFAHFNNQNPKDLVHKDMILYLNFVKREHGVGRDKCRLFAAAASFFYKHIFRTSLVFANELYPRKEFRLPEILSQEQMIHLLQSIKNPKHKLILGLFYGTGMRLGELCNLKMEAIDRKTFQIKIIGGKGNKDRFTLLPKQLLPKIRHFGFMQNHGKNARLRQIRQCLQLAEVTKIVQVPVAIKMLEKYGTDIFKCPCCAHGRLRIVNTVRFFKTQTQEIKEIQRIVNAKNKASPLG